MKIKAFTITATLLLSVFVSTSMLNQAQAKSFTATWAGYTFSDYDSFYREDVVAYESGSTAVLYVSVTHDNVTYAGQQLNVSAVGISLNWGDTFNSTQANRTNPVRLRWQESRIFTITFQVPSTANVSNLFRWDYKVYMEHVNAIGAVNDVETLNRGQSGIPSEYFVVYSADQVTSKQTNATIAGIKPPAKWNSTKAGIIWKRADNETSIANYYYRLGEFSNAVTHFENALSLKNAAFTAEETKGTRRDDAEIAFLEAQAKYYEGWGNYYNGLSNLGTLIGVALILFALGYIIRGLAVLRRAQTPS